jgi:hypothetical protein
VAFAFLEMEGGNVEYEIRREISTVWLYISMEERWLGLGDFEISFPPSIIYDSTLAFVHMYLRQRGDTMAQSNPPKHIDAMLQETWIDY